MSREATAQQPPLEVSSAVAESSLNELGGQAIASGTQPAIRYADDSEVDRVMADIFQKHDRLFAELAK